MRLKSHCALLVVLSLLFSCVFFGCSRSSQSISKSGFYFNTVITITIYDNSKSDLLDQCMELAGTYENYFSNTIPDSDISKINAANGAFVEVHPETIELLQKGIDYGRLSQGRFDITIGKLSDLWDFSTKALIEHPTEDFIPSSNEIAAALATVDYTAIQIKGSSVSLTTPGASIDLGGIAKGYIADKIKAFLLSQGVESGLINLGGNVLVLGEKTDGSSYHIAIQHPFDQDGSAIAAVEVINQSVVSSGTYERYFIVDDTLYHHILDTTTGYPYQNGLMGVTIISSDSVDGDALSTTCFALGLEDGMALIEQLPDTEAIFITEDEVLHTSSGIGTQIPFENLTN